MQLQAAFAGIGLAKLSRLGTNVYSLAPSFKDSCPLCSGSNCAVRHGVYHRRVVDAAGALIDRLPVPRFRCRRRGPRQPDATTFSVLPATVVPRRHFSLPLMLRVFDLVARRPSIPRVLDDLAAVPGARALFIEEVAVFRLLSFFARVFLCLEREEVRSLGLGADPGRTRLRALALAGVLTERGHTGCILAFHRRFSPRLLLAVHTA